MTKATPLITLFAFLLGTAGSQHFSKKQLSTKAFIKVSNVSPVVPKTQQSDVYTAFHRVRIAVTAAEGGIVTISWYPVTFPTNDVTYEVKYCRLVPYDKRNARSTTKDDNLGNKSTLNNEHKISSDGVSNKKIKSVRNEEVRYERAACKSTKTSIKTFVQIGPLEANTTYWYEITTFDKKKSDIYHIVGNFSTNHHTMTVPVNNPLTGIVIYSIVCGILIFLLFLSFCISYVTKWEKLMKNVAMKKGRKADGHVQLLKNTKTKKSKVNSYESVFLG